MNSLDNIKRVEESAQYTNTHQRKLIYKKFNHSTIAIIEDYDKKYIDFFGLKYILPKIKTAITEGFHLKYPQYFQNLSYFKIPLKDIHYAYKSYQYKGLYLSGQIEGLYYISYDIEDYRERINKISEFAISTGGSVTKRCTDEEFEFVCKAYADFNSYLREFIENECEELSPIEKLYLEGI